MPYQFSERGLEVQQAVRRYMDELVFPNEQAYYEQLAEVGVDGYPPVLDRLN